MTPEQSVVASAVQAWTMNIERADKLFSGLSDERMLTEIAPGKIALALSLGPSRRRARCDAAASASANGCIRNWTPRF